MENEVLTYAYRLLSKKDYTEFEIRKKFKSRFPNETGFFDSVIDKLKTYGYLDDEKFLNRFVLSKCRSGYGPYYIKYKLKEKGVYSDTETIQCIIENEVDQAEVIKSLITQKSKYKKSKDISTLKKKYFDFLSRRGFDTHLILTVLQEELKNESYFS